MPRAIISSWIVGNLDLREHPVPWRKIIEIPENNHGRDTFLKQLWSDQFNDDEQEPFCSPDTLQVKDDIDELGSVHLHNEKFVSSGADCLVVGTIFMGSHPVDHYLFATYLDEVLCDRCGAECSDSYANSAQGKTLCPKCAGG